MDRYLGNKVRVILDRDLRTKHLKYNKGEIEVLVEF